MSMSDHGLSRRHFMSGVGAGGLAIGASAAMNAPAAAQTTPATKTAATPASYYLVNARLETGFERDGQEVVATRTELRTLRVADGRIAEILPADAKAPAGAAILDARGLLVLPTFQDLHIHLDKTYYGGPWKAVRPNPNGVFDRIKEEQVMLPKLLPVAQERTGKLVDLMLSMGSTVARSHCNLDPTVGVKNLENLLAALSRRRDEVEVEIVAFPQHGLLYSQSESYMREAMKMGVQYVGGLDPTTVDGAMEKSLDLTFQIATDYKAGVDIHLHEGPRTGLPAIRRIMDLTEQAKLQNRVTVSHAFALASLSKEEAREMFARMASLGMTIATSVPIGKGAMPLQMLHESGVKVICGTDSVIEHWSPFGDGDILRKANFIAQQDRTQSEFGLNRALGFATGWVRPLDDAGAQVWPKAGDDATFNLVAASCSAEAVARVPARAAVFRKGRIVAGGLGKTA